MARSRDSTLRIAIVGGGSYRWSPTIRRDLAVRPQLASSRVVLYDIDREAVAEVHAWANERLLPELRSRLVVDKADALEHALDGADVVVLQIAVGGCSMRTVSTSRSSGPRPLHELFPEPRRGRCEPYPSHLTRDPPFL